LIRVLVRGSKDASAVRAALASYLGDPMVRVEHLRGARGDKYFERVVEAVRTYSGKEFVIVLAGKRDYCRELEDEVSKYEHAVLVRVGKADVRNAMLGEIISYLNLGKAMFRASLGWDRRGKSYLLKVAGSKIIPGLKVSPGIDTFFIPGNGGVKNLESLLSRNLCTLPLIVKGPAGLHDVYLGDLRVASIRVPDRGVRPDVLFTSSDVGGCCVGLSDVAYRNSNVLSTYEGISIRFLRSVDSEVENFIVPWSGGKDSTAILLLAIKAFGRSSVKAVYVDTGVDFPTNKEYVEEVSRLLGVDVRYVRAPVVDELLSGRPRPTHEDRWCTILKLKALSTFIKEEFKGSSLVIIGDRDAESAARSRRSLIRVDGEGVVNAYPIRLWGATHVQAYLALNGVPLNKLYLEGFYRIGCYICPALRSWELYVLLRSGIMEEVAKLPFGKLLLGAGKG